MDDIWNYLREFESKDLVKRFIKNKFDYSINTTKAHEITSAFAQARGYFNAYLISDISVKPLLQYYGVVALSRGLILILRKSASENNIIPSHGLTIKNWNEVAKPGKPTKFEDIILKSSKGTFSEILAVTENMNYFRHGSSGIGPNWGYEVPPKEIEFGLKDLAFCLPNLIRSVNVWLNMKVPIIQLSSLKIPDNKIEIRVGKGQINVLNQIFDETRYSELTIFENARDCIVTFNKEGLIPNFSQMWDSGLGGIGDIYITSGFETGIRLNDISKMYSLSYVFGNISRYYPSVWNNVNKGIADDSILPFIINLMELIQNKYPQMIVDFIKKHKEEKRD